MGSMCVESPQSIVTIYANSKEEIDMSVKSRIPQNSKTQHNNRVDVPVSNGAHISVNNRSNVSINNDPTFKINKEERHPPNISKCVVASPRLSGEEGHASEGRYLAISMYDAQAESLIDVLKNWHPPISIFEKRQFELACKYYSDYLEERNARPYIDLCTALDMLIRMHTTFLMGHRTIPGDKKRKARRKPSDLRHGKLRVNQ